MYLHEYQSKQYFARYGIPTPPGRTATTEQAARDIAAEFGSAVVVNAQALAGPRVFRLATTPDEAEHIARDILAMTIAGVRVRTLLLEPAQDVALQMTLGIHADRGNTVVMLAALEGQATLRETINPLLGLHDFQARNLANGLNLPRENWSVFTQIARNLYHCFSGCDAVRAEINPLGLLADGRLLALGGKLVIDDNALYRQPEIAAIRDTKAEHETAVQARAAGINYVRLSGTVGCIVNGAGLGMAAMDLLTQYGLAASSFLDLGSDFQRDKIAAALRLILPEARSVLFSLFADKTNCETMAQELLAAVTAVQPAIPLVVRLAGCNHEAGQALLAASGQPGLVVAPSVRAGVERLLQWQS